MTANASRGSCEKIGIKRYSPPCITACALPTSRPLDTGAFWDNRRERRSPLLGKGGVAAPSSKWSRSFGGAAGVVRSTSDNRWLEPTILSCFALSGSHSLRSCPSAPAKEASRHFLNGRRHPSFPRRGVRLSLRLFSMPTVSRNVGHAHLARLGMPSAPHLRLLLRLLAMLTIWYLAPQRGGRP